MTSSGLAQKVARVLKNIYIRSPVNFSFISGLRYPGIPRLKGHFLLGRLPTLFKENGSLENIIQAGKLAEQHASGACYFWLGMQLAILLTRPTDIQALKIKHEEKLSRDLPLLRKAVGSSIFTDERETWQQKREACKHALSHEAVERLKPGMEQVIHQYMAALRDYEDRAVELRTVFFNMVVDIVTINVMGCPMRSLEAGEKKVQIERFTELSHYLSETLHEVWQMHNIFKCMLPGFIRKIFFRGADDFATVRDKMQKRYYLLFLAPNKADILAGQNLIKAIWDINNSNRQGNQDYQDKDILGDGASLLAAGVATTVATLEFVVKLLAAHPDKAEKLRAEIREHVQNDAVSMEALKQMAYLDMIIKETMRLYPAAPFFMPREIADGIEINGIPLFKGDVPIFSPYVLHRSKHYWDNPEEFIPERFSKENQRNIHPNAYMPFSIGPRFCAGQQFATQEIKLVLIALYSRYTIEVMDNSFALTLKQGGLAPAMPPVAHLRRNK